MKAKKHSFDVGLILSAIVMCWRISANSIAKDEEIEVKLQFLEYELEDFCVLKNEAEWKFLNGSAHDLKKLLDIEERESDFYKHELEVLQKHMGKKFASKRLQRLMDIFSHPGAPLLGKMEFKEYRDYSLKLQELIGKMKIPCESDPGANNVLNLSLNADEKCSPIDNKKINKILFTEKKEEKLKILWSEWYRTLEEKNIKTKYDFVQQLSILDLEAEQNGEEDLTDYWLKKIDTTWVNYEAAQNLWKQILPLYNKLKNFIKSLVTESYGKDLERFQNIIPVHVLGSLVAHNWIRAAEKLGAFDTSHIYKSLQNCLNQKNVEDLYKAADNLTAAELKLGYLPLNFYENSRFDISSRTCQHKIMDYCEKENFFRVMFCANETINIGDYIQINKNVIRMKYQLLSGKEEEENGFLFREGPRESVLYEAIESLSSLRSLWPETLENQELLMNHSQHQKTMLSLLTTALHVIPPLPYYLLSDLWRINALKEIDATVGENVDTTTSTAISSTSESSRKREIKNQSTKVYANSSGYTDGDVLYEGNVRDIEADHSEASKTYDTRNLTREWWSYRHEFQGVGSPDGELYDDYLQDINIIWNKPYLSKFLGNILQFQILEKTNLTKDLSNLHTVLQKGKSEPWQDLVEKYFNITEISVTPLLLYFKPLEEFLDKEMKLKNCSQIFSFNDLDFSSQGLSHYPTKNEGEAGEKPAEGSDALFLSLAIIAAVGVVALIVTIGRRRYKRKQRTRDRKRKLANF